MLTLVERICIMFITIHWILLLFLRKRGKWTAKKKKITNNKKVDVGEVNASGRNEHILYSFFVDTNCFALYLCVSMAFIAGIRLKFFFLIFFYSSSACRHIRTCRKKYSFSAHISNFRSNRREITLLLLLLVQPILH